ncbi:hypothetical protein KEM48_009021 [Puccinia striiformis f. sp. tritici PST-130]|nr:hypothetical protein KEM48_009021 [Puccinia striiformis f. sp. tritici PST-130]
MEEISPPSNNNKTLNTCQSSLSAQPPLNAFAELESSLPPLPETGRTYSPQGPIDFNQGVSPKDINQYATSLALASSRSTPVPMHVERLRQDRPPVLQPALIPIPTEENRQERPTTALALSENHQEPQVSSTGEEPYIPPSAIATTMLDQQWTLFQRAQQSRNVPVMRTALQQAISTQELLLHLVGHEEMLRVSLQWIARDELALLEESIQNNNSEHSDPSADANHADGYVDPGSPRNESNPYRQRTGVELLFGE